MSWNIPIIIIRNIASGLPGPKLIAGDSNAPGLFWSTIYAPNCLFPFFEIILQGGWNQHATDLTGNRSILDLIFTIGVTHVRLSAETSLPGCDHLPVSRSFMFPLPNRYSRPYFRADWICSPILVRKSNWDSYFLTRKLQVASGQIHCDLRKCLHEISPSHTLRMTRKRTYCDGISMRLW